MNEIKRLGYISGEQVDCYDNEQIIEVLEQITVGINTANQFFDVLNFNDKSKADYSYETLYVETSLNRYHG